MTTQGSKRRRCGLSSLLPAIRYLLLNSSQYDVCQIHSVQFRNKIGSLTELAGESKAE